MKALKWFRYGVLSLGSLIFLLLIFPLPSFFITTFDSCMYFFILYFLLSIVELCVDKKRFEPKNLYYCGAIMCTIVAFSGSKPYTLMRNLLKHYFSYATADKTVEIIVWVYFVLAAVLLLTGVIWGNIIVYKKIRNNTQKYTLLSETFFSFGMMFLLICVLLFVFGVLEPVGYNGISFKDFTTSVSYLLKISFIPTIPMFILGLVYKIISLVKVQKERGIINDKN